MLRSTITRVGIHRTVTHRTDEQRDNHQSGTPHDFDSARAVDAGIIAAITAIATETATGADNSRLGVVGAEAASGADSGAPAASLGTVEVGHGLDAATSAAALPGAETATGTDAGVVNQSGSSPVSGTETGTVALAGTVAASLTLTEAATGADQGVPAVVGNSPPGTPTNFSVVPVTASEIDLAWTDVDTTEVWHSTDGVTYAMLVSLGPGTTSYQHTGLAAASVHWYEVRATNTNGTSAFTAPLSATVGSWPSPYVKPPPHVAIPAGAQTDHPRLLMRSSDVATFRSTWSVNSNNVWVDIQSPANQQKAKMDANGGIFPNDSGNIAGSGFPQDTTEDAMGLFAFMSLIDPNAANRADYASRAHSLLMYLMNQEVLGYSSGTPYRDPGFMTSDRMRWVGHWYPLTVDWIYPNLSVADKATIRKVLLLWMQTLVGDGMSDIGHPFPVGIFDDPQLLATTGAFSATRKIRWTGNNYYASRENLVGLFAMCMDMVDDIPTATTDPPAGTLGDFIGYLMHSHFYVRAYAEANDLIGGVNYEGGQYERTSSGNRRELYAALRIAGYDDTATYGVNANIGGGDYWTVDDPTYVLCRLYPAQKVLSTGAGPSWMYSTFGDMQAWQPTELFLMWCGMGLWAKYSGNTALRDQARWAMVNLVNGGPTQFDITLKNCMSNTGAIIPVASYLLLDPTLPAPADPRPSHPRQFDGKGLNRVVMRTDWTTTATFFSWKASFNTANHQAGDAGMFELWRKGECLTMPSIGYGANADGSDVKNTLSLQNNPCAGTNYNVNINQYHGSQYFLTPVGDPAVVYSFPVDGFYGQADITNLCNASNDVAEHDITHASRSIFWLRPDFVIVYDRATSSAGHYKRQLFNTLNQPTIAGQVATASIASGQQLFITSMLPATTTLSTRHGYPSDHDQGIVPINITPPPEIGANAIVVQWQTLVEDLSAPATCRLLAVLQGADAGASRTVPVLVQSSAGDAYDGAQIGSTALMFKQDITHALVTTTFTVPSGTKVYVTGLTPAATYSANVVSILPASAQVTVAPGAGSAADAGGVLVVQT